MICKIGLCLVVALALATCSDAGKNKFSSNIAALREKFRGGDSSATAAASAAAGANGVGGSAAASAAATGVGNPGVYPPANYYQVPPQQPYFVPQEPYVKHPQAYRAPHSFPARRFHDHRPIPEPVPFNPYAAPAYGQQPLQYDQFDQYDQYNQYGPPRHSPHASHGHFKGPRGPVYAPNHAATSSAAAAASAGGRNGGGAATAAAAVSSGHQHQRFAPQHDRHSLSEEGFHEHYSEPETEERYEAHAGTFGGPRNSFEEGSYVKDLEEEVGHEHGHQDSDSYLNTQARSKSLDENHYTALDDSNDELYHTPHLMHHKKNKINFVQSSSKQQRESGSGVISQEKSSSGYNKDLKKLRENIDQRFSKGSDGKIHNENFNSHTDVDDEDVMFRNNRGLGNFPGINGHNPHGHAASAAAAATAATGGASAAASGASHRR